MDGDDVRRLVANLTGNARLFAQTRKLLGWGERAIEVVEDEEEQAPEITSEFYPPSEQASQNGTLPDGPAAQAQPLSHSAFLRPMVPAPGVAKKRFGRVINQPPDEMESRPQDVQRNREENHRE